MLRLHILPELGRWPLAGLRRAHIEQCAAALPLAPSSVRTLHRTLSSLLASAVEDERIPRNQAFGVRLPKVVDEQVVPITVDEVRALTCGHREPVDRSSLPPSQRPVGVPWR